MQGTVEKKRWTDEALMALPRDGRKYELLHGEVVVSPTGFQHGYIALRLASKLMTFVLEQRLGVVVDSSTGFRMADGDCLSPDVSFVSKHRLSGDNQLTTGFFEGAPDLAVEVVSPRESQKRLKEKLTKYFANGTQAAWVIDLKTRKVTVYQSAIDARQLEEGEQLEGGCVVPGFQIAIRDLFEMPELGS